MKYTVILRRSNYLLDLLDDYDSSTEFYVANPDTDFANPQAAAKAAKEEAAKADVPEVRHAMAQRGMSTRGLTIETDNYEVLMVFEGQHTPLFGWQPELCAINENFGG